MKIQSPMVTTIVVIYPDIVGDICAQDCLFFLRIRDETGRSRVQTSFDTSSETQPAGYASEPMCMDLKVAISTWQGEVLSKGRAGSVCETSFRDSSRNPINRDLLKKAGKWYQLKVAIWHDDKFEET